METATVPPQGLGQCFGHASMTGELCVWLFCGCFVAVLWLFVRAINSAVCDSRSWTCVGGTVPIPPDTASLASMNSTSAPERVP